MNRVLVVDDDAGMRSALEARFLRRGWQVETASYAAEAIAKFRRVKHPLVVTDIRMPGEDGFAVMRAVRELVPHTGVILLTAFASVPEAVAAMKDGACDYLVKPVSFEQLEQAAERILGQAKTEKESTQYLCGHSPAWLGALDRARRAAASDADILIEAESGTGKELVARWIHRMSPRREHPFIAINCAAFPDTLLESELFGHAKGAFTGAVNAKPGKLELAHGGTLLLDEVGEIPLGLQPKLLRALQEKEFERLGSTRTIPVDVRLVAATNRNLEKMVADREFRSDLYYRLRVFPITIPSLRERREDIPLLVRYFVAKHARRLDRQIDTIPADVMKALTKWDWPGNIRELENFIERAVILTRGHVLRVPLAELQVPMEEVPQSDSTLEATEREHILKVLREAKGMIGGAKGAAARLGLKRTTLNSKLKKLGIEREDYI
jgi:DNA-binding NtrC family response regulator